MRKVLLLSSNVLQNVSREQSLIIYYLYLITLIIKGTICGVGGRLDRRYRILFFLYVCKSKLVEE